MNESGKQEITDDVVKLHRAGADLEMLLLFMRERGLFQIDSIIALRQIMKMSMQEAKQAVDESETWSDQFDRTVEARRLALKALVRLSEENDVSLPKISIQLDSDLPEA